MVSKLHNKCRLIFDLNSLSKRVRVIFFPFLIYFIGALSLFLSDVVVKLLFSDGIVAEWAVVKSVVFTVAAVAAMGLDQAFAREPSKWEDLKGAAILFVFGAAFILASVAFILNLYDNPFPVALASIAIALSGIVFNVFRSSKCLNLAFISRECWKPLFLVGIVIFSFAGINYFDWLIFFCATPPLVVCLFVYGSRRRNVGVDLFDDIKRFRDALRVGIPFALSSISLSIAMYGESLLLAMFGSEGLIADFFVANLCYLASVVFLNTFISSIMLGYIRANPKRWVSFLKEYGKYLFVAVAVSSVSFYFIGVLINNILFSDVDIPILWAIFISITASVRLGYTLISSTIAGLSVVQDITRVCSSYFIVCIVFVLVAYGLNRVIADAGLAMALATALHWVLRSMVGIGALRRVLQRYAI